MEQQNPPFPGPELRERALAMDPIALGLAPEQIVGSTFGFVMDSAFSDSDNWFTLVLFAEGSTSLYTSGSFGILGGGERAEVRALGRQLLELVNRQLASFEPNDDTAIPQPGFVVLRALTLRGQQSIAAPESELIRGDSVAAQIFQGAHAVISALSSNAGI